MDFNSLLHKWKPVTYEESLGFVKKVKARDYQLYVSLFNILSRKEQLPSEIYHELWLLFEHHDDLRQELMRFKPFVQERTTNHNSFGISIFLLPVFLLSLFLLFEQSLRYIAERTFGMT